MLFSKIRQCGITECKVLDENMNDDKTIFALASAPGRAGVAVFRVSGKAAVRVSERLCRPAGRPEPRVAALRKIAMPLTGEIIDRALVLYFPAPHSFTGEDVVEIHTHGGRAVINAVASALGGLPEFRLAEPGEFTRRAFENGKMDLTEAEAVADLVHAETEAQRRMALRQMDGALGRLYEDWRERLAQGLAWIEAAIDFSEEELPVAMIDEQAAALRILRGEIERHLDDGHRGERLREGFSVVILGPPNAGKSSLLNALARREAAIVSPTPGTTRDVIEVHLDIGGYPVILADTAGLRQASFNGADAHGKIEAEGIRRAWAHATDADLKIVAFDGATWPEKDAASEALIGENAIVVVNKSDLLGDLGKNAEYPLFVSAKTGAGIDALVSRLEREIAAKFRGDSAPPLTRARHREALEECVSHLERAESAAQIDLMAEDVRLAMRALGRITGRVDVEDLLDIIFRDFCIGK